LAMIDGRIRTVAEEKLNPRRQKPRPTPERPRRIHVVSVQDAMKSVLIQHGIKKR
jgi:hypothetical protein